MTERNPKYDKTFKQVREVLERVEKIEKDAAADKTKQAVVLLASMAGEYRRQLIQQGFTSAEVMQMLLDWQKVVLEKIKV